MTTKNITGSCLCGAVEYQITSPMKIFQYCHCSCCRKFTGSAHSANFFVKPKNFKWLQGENSVGRFEHPDAKHFATGFCQVCGSSLPWKNQSGSIVVIPAGTLDEDPGIRPMQNIFWDSRADWYVDASDLDKFSELPIKE